MRKLLAIAAAAAAVIGFTTATVAPAQAASTPTILTISNRTPLPAGGQNEIVTGTNLNLVTSVVVDKAPGRIVSQTATKLVFILPAHALGKTGITLYYGTNKTYAYPNSLVYKVGPSRALVPLPYIPDTLKVGATFSMVPGEPAWATTVTSLTPTLCSVDSALNVKALKKGTCQLQISIVLDTMDPNYRGRDAMYDLTVN